MENIFVTGYRNRVKTTGSILCPRISLPERIPPGYRYPKGGNYWQSAKDYLYAVIDVISGLVPAVEFQKGSYSVRGKEGESLLERVIERAQNKHHLCVILDIVSGDVDREEDVEAAFSRYGVDACTFIATPNFPNWKELLKKGHMPIFAGPRIALSQDSKAKSLELCQYKAKMASIWTTKARKIHKSAAIGCLVKAEEAILCREVAGYEVFFLVSLPDDSRDFKADELIGGLMNSRRQPMGAINNLDIASSWWDEEEKKPREGKTLDLVKAAVQSANVKLNAALERKFGK